MTSINDAPEEVRAAIDKLYADASADGSLLLEHHGIKGMHWGVRSRETLRKYGLLAKGAAAKAGKAIGAGASRASQIAKVKMDAARSSVSKASKASVDKVKATANAKKAEAIAKQQEKKQQRAEEKEQRKEIGMSKRKFDKLRETTLKSHDPEVVAKGMHTLTDKELHAKLERLSTESRISGMAYANQKNEATVKKTNAEARAKQMDAIKASPLYDILASPVKAVTTDVIQNQLYNNGLMPILNAKVSSKRDSVLDGMGLLGEEQPSKVNRVAEAVKTARDQMNGNDAQPNVKPSNKPSGSSGSKPSVSDRIAETAKSKINNLGAKVTSSAINSAQQRAASERGKAAMTADRIAKAQKEFDRYNSVVEEGRTRNAAREQAAASAPKKSSAVKVEQEAYRPKPNPAAGKKSATSYSNSSAKGTNYTQRAKRPDVHKNNIGSISPGIVEANVVSSTSRRAERSGKRAARR